MSWQEELDGLLQRLGVHQERSQSPSPEEPAGEADLTFTQLSKRHPGVSYRMDLVGAVAHLRVYVPVEEGAAKLQVYHVQLANDAFVGHLFALFMTHEGGSVAYQEVEGELTYYLFIACTQAMKALFWQGDMQALSFPPEITVERLL